MSGSATEAAQAVVGLNETAADSGTVIVFDREYQGGEHH